MNKTTYEQELENKGFLLYTTVGRSMRPFLRSGEDLMRIEAPGGERFRKFDVVLYRRDSGKYVLHRIVKVREGDYVLCGDNCWQLEPGIRDDQILGVLKTVIRNGHPMDVNSRDYRLRVRLWWLLYPLRAALLWCRDKFYVFWKKYKQGRACCPAKEITMAAGMDEQLNMYRRCGMEAVYLAACALKGECPQLNRDLDLNELYRFCKFQTITSIVAMALETGWKAAPPEDPGVMKPWKQAKEKAIRKNILLNAERQLILQHLEEIGCWYMPLKGSLLQHDYPKFGMRQMSDNDILYDPAFQTQIHDYMLSQGYEATVYQKGNHDEYVKQPVYNMEMHKGLFMSSQCPELSAYYRDVRRILIKDADNGFGYHLSAEDFYIYLVGHAYKHYVHSGVGIRNLLDVYVYVTKHGDTLDWEYISRELRKFGAEAFEKECRMLSLHLLSQPSRAPELTDREREVLDLYFTSGTFGTKERAVENLLQSSGSGTGFRGKLRYLLRRLFPSVQYMIDMEPKLERKRWLLPFAYIRRLFRGAFTRRRDIAREVSYLNGAKKEK